MQAKYSLKSATIGYGSFQIKNVDFEIVPSIISGVVGRSGSGKSTLLKTITGELPVLKSGFFEKQNFSLGYSPQENALFSNLTIEENIILFAKLYNVPKQDMLKNMVHLLSRMDLSPHKEKRINQLSGGMKKRADLACALIHNPNVLILDEPFAGLDFALQEFIWGLLHELSTQGTAIIITSHLLDDIQKNCHQINLIENNVFYGYKQLEQEIQSHQGSLQTFLEKIFREDIKREQ